MKKEVQRFDLDPIFIWDNIQKYLPKYIVINFNNFYHMKDDVMIEVYLRVMKYRTYNKDKTKISTYLTNVCRNVIFSFNAMNKKRIEREFVYIDKYDIIDNDINYSTYTDDLDKRLDDDDLKKHIKAILNNCTKVEQFIINEKYFKEKSNKEIYEYLQINNETFLRYMKRIKIKLTDIFDNDEFIIDYCMNNDIDFDKMID